MTVDLNNSQQVQALRDRLRHDLLEDIVPFWLNHGVDSEYGGVITSLDRDGTIVDTDKSMWAQGRFAWLMGRLCTDIEPREEWLAAGQATIEFLKQFGFDSADGRMWFQVTRDGRPIRRRRYAFTESFAAIAFGRWSSVNDDPELRSLAWKCLDQFCAHHESQKKFTAIRPSKSIGLAMMTLVTAQELRESIRLGSAESIIDLCIQEIRTDFCKPQIQCVMETVAPDGQLLDHFDGRTLNPGHAIEAAWFILREGQTRDDESLVELGCQMLDWMWQRGWDQQYGGLYGFVSVDDRPIQEITHNMKYWWPHAEAIIATLLAWKLTGRQDWADRFATVFEWTMQHFPDPRHGEWFGYLQRDGSPVSSLKGNLWKGPFHVPRMFMECLRILT